MKSPDESSDPMKGYMIRAWQEIWRRWTFWLWMAAIIALCVVRHRSLLASVVISLFGLAVFVIMYADSIRRREEPEDR